MDSTRNPFLLLGDVIHFLSELNATEKMGKQIDFVSACQERLSGQNNGAESAAASNLGSACVRSAEVRKV